ncbi:MAG: hypothetical protein KAY50_04710 [Chitinophagaceae bacterium]|nr:hypothetical protein [Chitinophagaceae bacterium]HQZ78946.1 hypothetical protein [Bacteroidia bacterium]
MRNIFLPLLFVFLFISCDDNKKSPEPEITKDTTIVQPPVSENLQKVTYKSATYYTGRVDFYFTDETGETITIGISNFPEDKGAIYPKSLLQSTDTTEGPPSENPAMVGKHFFLVKNAEGKLIEIRTVD